ncbi:MAG: HTH domain-containing protein, partial [Deltaproteobacteria bacterium]|nr:HTH domain-containing protein [Deltaproteobacteria bacterium]
MKSMNIHRFQGREGGAKTKFRPQFRRLYEIDRLIRDGEYPNYRTLSEKLGISRKTAQRDVELLRDGMQAPIGFDSGRRGFYYTP